MPTEEKPSHFSERVKIGFVTKNWLGDILMQTPAIHVLRENFPESEIIGFVPARCHAILANNPDIDRLMPFHEKEDIRGFFNLYKFMSETRHMEIAKIYLFHRSFSRAMIFALAGAKRRIGYATKGRGWILTDPVAEPLESLHQTDYFLNLLKKSGLNIPEDVTSTRFYPSAKDRERVEEILSEYRIDRDNFIVMNIGANWAPKRWSAENFAKLSDYFKNRFHADVILSGSISDRAAALAIIRLSKKEKVVDLTGKTSLGVLGALFERAVTVVSGDSGPMHIAASVGAPLLALFLSTDARLTGPRGVGPAVIVQKREAMRRIDQRRANSESIQVVPEISPEVVIDLIEKSGLMEGAFRTPEQFQQDSPYGLQ